MVAVAWAMVHDSALLGVSHQVVDDVMCGSQLANLSLHRVFQYAFLLLDERALLLVVFDALAVLAPVAAPPVAPGVFAGGAAVCAGGVALFASGSAFSAGPQAAAFVADDGNEAAAAEEAEGDFEDDDIW